MTPREARFAKGILYRDDCLARLAKLLDEGDELFDLVYVDPPFNTGRAHTARLRQGARVDGITAYADHWGGLDAFLNMLEPRLQCLRQLLSPVGSVWIHLDHRAVHDCKVLADAVFGRAAYLAEIVWVPGNGGRRKAGPSVTHQTILVYAPSGRMIWNVGDAALREPYAELSLKMHFKGLDEQGRRYRERSLGGKTYRYYAEAGRQIGSVWSDCPAMRANTPLVAETTGYPTQKPESLLTRIVRAASSESSRVLDPMCGSGTTLAVAARLGRRFVGIDRSAVAYRIAEQRLRALRS